MSPRCIHNHPLAIDGSGCWRCLLRPVIGPPPPPPAAGTRDAATRRRDELRAAVFRHYGTECACCGTTEQLTIDHIGGDGGEHRRQLFGRQMGGVHFYAWLVRNRFPDGYQTLCAPCNRSKWQGDTCRIDHTRRTA